jgi:GMP synthase-like glutamine amidotransferase
MRAHCFQHEPFEGMAAIETWLKKKDFTIAYTYFFENGQIPAVNDIDWLILMGGSMSVNDEKEFPWLVKEKEFVRQCIKQGKVVIGTCLGAQMIANSLGAKVFKNTQKEIGWFPIQKSSWAHSNLFTALPNELPVFHWHGETFDLPEGADLMASSEACKNQIFTINKNVIGFQCHLETTHESLISLSDNCRSELVPTTYIQSENQMIADEKKYSARMQTALFGILDNLLLINKSDK